MVTVLDSIDASRMQNEASASRRDQSGARFRVEYSPLLDFRQDRVGDPV